MKAAALVPNAKPIEVHRPANLTHALRSMEGDAKMMNMKKDYTKMGKLPTVFCSCLITNNEQKRKVTYGSVSVTINT